MAPYILPSGGPTSKVKTTEWEFLRDKGISLGVPEDVIFREDQASNTFENARFSWDVLQQHRIHPLKIIIERDKKVDEPLWIIVLNRLDLKAQKI